MEKELRVRGCGSFLGTSQIRFPKARRFSARELFFAVSPNKFKD